VATIKATQAGGGPNVGRLSAAQAGSAVSTNIVDVGLNKHNALLTITTTVGATPTCTYAIEGSADGTAWYAVQYADLATPDTWAVSTFVITTAGTTHKVIRGGVTPWRYLRVTYSANTNVTNTADLYVF
jgi:hypothetical protein